MFAPQHTVQAHSLQFSYNLAIYHNLVPFQGRKKAIFGDFQAILDNKQKANRAKITLTSAGKIIIAAIPAWKFLSD